MASIAVRLKRHVMAVTAVRGCATSLDWAAHARRGGSAADDSDGGHCKADNISLGRRLPSIGRRENRTVLFARRSFYVP